MSLLKIESTIVVQNLIHVPSFFPTSLLSHRVFFLTQGRVTYVLDKDGVCQSVYDELADAASHVDKAEEVLQTMKPASAGGLLAGLFN